ncbi:shikimate dehydrogenase, partial [Klebsiella pneumoniae]|nr:shikimate dehydrogenase [Klebsiella pneumoniae]
DMTRQAIKASWPEMALAQMRLMGQFIGAIPQAQGAAA